MKIKSYQGAGIAMFYNGNNGYEILLGKRSVLKDYGKWSIPGGAKERYDSTFEGAAKREFYEETGVRISDISCCKLDGLTINFPFFKWETYFYITKEKNLSFNPREFSELKWVNIKNLKNYELCFGVKQEVKHFERLLKKTSRIMFGINESFKRTCECPLKH